MTETPQNAIRSYRPGGWYAIFGEQASVLLPESEKPRVAALWELVDSGAGFDELLDALIATGLRSLPGFVLVSTAEEPTRIVLRGSARAEVTLANGEQSSVDGGAAATWVEKALPDVASLQLVLEDDGEAVDFGIRSGLVRVSRIDQPPYAEGSGAAAGSAVAAPVLEAEPTTEPTTDIDAAAVDEPEAGAAVAEAPEAASEATQGEGFAPSAGGYAAPVVGAFTAGAIGGAHAGEPQAEDADEITGAQEDIGGQETDGTEEQSSVSDEFAAESFQVEGASTDEAAFDEPSLGAPADGMSPENSPTGETPTGETPTGETPTGDALVDEAPAGFESAESAELVDDQPTEAHAFPFFNDDYESEVAPSDQQPVAEQPFDQAGGEQSDGEQSDGNQTFGDQPFGDPAAAQAAPDAGSQESAPSEPVWGQAPQGNAYAPPEAPSNPFAPGAGAPEPPMWTPPEQSESPQWGAPPGVEAQPEAPQWGAPAEAQPEAPQWGAPPEQGSDEHDGHTQAGSYNPGEFARQHPGIPGQPQAPSVTAQPVARLAFSNGDTVDVDRAVLVGRAPEARRFTSTDQPRLVTVTSPNQEISSTHLEVRPGSGVDHGSAIVTDMGSTNGTVLTQPGFAPEDLQPGIAVQLLPGSVIDLGDGVTIQVTSI